MKRGTQIRLFILFLFFVVTATPIYAAPAITGVSGILANGNSITVTGSGFGAKTSAPPSVSSYDNSVAANNFHSAKIGGSWGTRSTTAIGNSSSYRRSAFYQSDYYANCPFQSGDYSQLKWDSPTSADTYYYVSMWFYVTSSSFVCAGSGGNTKIIRWYTNELSSVQELYDNGTVNGGLAESYRASKDGGQGGADEWSSFLSSVPLRTWNHLEWWVYSGTSGSTNGFMKTVINGKTARTWTGIGMVSSSYPHTMNYWRFGNVSGDNTAGGSILLDQLYIDNTQAHVFISDRADITNWLAYSGAAHNEVQVSSAWSASSITFKMNQGTFTNGQTVYLYVVDPNGAINATAYPITIGGSGDGGTQTLSPPPNFHKE
jgi:hypothetical protein